MAFNDDTDFTYLVDAADLGRDNTIETLHGLKRRLMAAGTVQNEGEAVVPTAQGSTPPVTTPTTSSTAVQDQMQQSGRTRRTDSTPSVTKTWTKDYTYPSGEEDTTSGAENSRNGKSKRASIGGKVFGMFKPVKQKPPGGHNRQLSWSDKEIVSQAPAPVQQQPQILEEGGSSVRSSQSREGHRRQVSTASPSSSLSNAVPYRPPPSPPPPSNDKPFPYPDCEYEYESWEEDPRVIWGAATATTTRSAERRETVHIAPDGPPSPVHTYRTNSGNGTHLHSTTVYTPNYSNEYLGLCKSASRLQNGERRALDTRNREPDPWSRHPVPSGNALHFLSCANKACHFRSKFNHTDIEVIWNKLLPERKGIRVRWKFLAKSHVPLKRAGSEASYQCLFCVFQQGGSGVYHGAELYLEHIANEHRGSILSEIVLYKTVCVSDRVCAEDDLDWDINLYPISGANPRAGIAATPGLSSNAGADQSSMPFNPEDYMSGGWKAKMEDNRYDSVIGANEPWNEGLSDFHYRGNDFDRTELE